MNDYSKSKLKEIKEKFGTDKNDKGGRSVNPEGKRINAVLKSYSQ